MQVVVEARGEARLEDAEEMRSLSLGTSLPSKVLAERMIELGLGRFDAPDHVWLSPTVLSSLAGQTTDAWTNGFEAMLSYARVRGWVDRDGFVRAHVERRT